MCGEGKTGLQIMVTVKSYPDHIPVSVIPAGDTADNTVRIGVICLDGDINVIVIKKHFEFGFLGGRRAVDRFILCEITLPGASLPGFFVSGTVNYRGSGCIGGAVASFRNSVLGAGQCAY